MTGAVSPFTVQLIRCLLSTFYLNMFPASLCPSSGDQDRVLLHMVFSTQPQPAQTVQNAIRSNTRSCSPDDGQNDARNILR
jgi:hypothetical protein